LGPDHAGSGVIVALNQSGASMILQ
jgi:hypothetical protein